MRKAWGVGVRPLAAGVCGLLLQLGSVAMATSGSEQDWERHLDALERIEAIQDPLERCLAMPAPPETHWPEGLWNDSCRFDLAPRQVVQVDDIYRMLDAGELETLDALFRGYQAQDEAHPDGSLTLRAALKLFRRLDAISAGERWARLAPDSVYARMAGANAALERAWRARGTAFAQQTSRQQFREMRRFMDTALAHATRALELDEGLVQACALKAQVGRVDSRPDVRERALAHCLRVAPDSFQVWSEIYDGAEPRWGGSVEALAGVAAEARSRVARNPMLARLARDPEVLALVSSGDVRREPDLADARYPLLRPEALASTNRSIADAFASTARRTERYRESVAFLSMALLRETDEDRRQHDLYERGVDLQRLGRYAWSLRDWDLHVAKVPTGSWNHFYRGQALFALERHDEARDAYEDAYRFFPDSRRRSLERLWELEMSQERVDAAVLVLRRLNRLAPQDARYWFTLAELLYDLDRDGFEEAANQFVERAPRDPGNERLMAAHATMADMRAEWGRRRIEGPPEG
ncbi:tetratricopeptide repeat protein [Alkalisalibacterium limincola]|nr:tetratricopeptide repeat protein [Alkalisalibacterium limincola]